MNIFFIASEAAPLAKTGGLADVVGSLPKELRRRGHDARIIIPWYREVGRNAKDPVAVVDKLAFPCGSIVE
ncbi:MAG TPA: glycogen/starch synthase, partial [Geobacteraceae bacterium]